jgi:hypothetical protein
MVDNFLLVITSPLALQDYKRTLTQPLPHHTRSKPPPFQSHPKNTTKLSLTACQFCSATEPLVHSLVPNDLATKISPVDAPLHPLQHIQKSLQEKSRCNQNLILHGCCPMSAHILCTRPGFKLYFFSILVSS